MAKGWIEDWNAEDEDFWERMGKSIARRNLLLSIFAEFLGFSVWSLWSVTAVFLNQAGFDFSPGQLFTLVAVPAIVGATMRFPYTLAVPKFGGRNWTVCSALLLLVPVGLLVALVSRPGTPFWAFLIGGAFAGLGGGNFASSMANISFFYPDRKKGLALGLNAAGGNMGVAAAQLLVPIAVTWQAAGRIGGGSNFSKPLFLANAGLVWIPFILIAALLAWFYMDNLKVSTASLKQQFAVFKRKQTWVLSWLYVGTFGSFIGFSAGLPLLIKTEFPGVSLSVAFLGPLVGSLSRPFGGWLSDRLGGARVTFASFLAMGFSVLGVTYFLQHKEASFAFAGFIGTFVLLFLLAGIGNGSTYRMIPIVYRAIHTGGASPEGPVQAKAMLSARRETAAAVGFIGAVGAYGGWLIPQGYGVSAAVTGTPVAAFRVFLVFYVLCLALTWWYYLRSKFAIARAPSFAEARV